MKHENIEETLAALQAELAPNIEALAKDAEGIKMLKRLIRQYKVAIARACDPNSENKNRGFLGRNELITRRVNRVIDDLRTDPDLEAVFATFSSQQIGTMLLKVTRPRMEWAEKIRMAKETLIDKFRTYTEILGSDEFSWTHGVPGVLKNFLVFNTTPAEKLRTTTLFYQELREDPANSAIANNKIATAVLTKPNYPMSYLASKK